MISIQRLEDTIKFTFENNPLYLHDGTIEVPVNSLSLLIDESNIATFKKADSNDIFLSCSLDELGMTKEELLTWYKENATDAGGMSPEEVEEIVEEATENLFGYAEYDSQSTRINFKHDASGDVITYIDATDFVIDGMIDNVEIVTVQGVKYLKITFNTESGKEPILIPLSDIFNPDEYYTKTEVDNAISAATSGKVDVDVFEEKERVISASLVDLNERKADSSAVTEAISAAVSGKADTSAVTQEISAAVSGKADTSAVTEAISAAVSGKADSSAVTQEISAAVSGKADSSAVTQEISAAVSGKADTATTYTKTEVDSALANKADTSRLGGLSLVKLTQAEYDILPNKDANTLYVIV